MVTSHLDGSAASAGDEQSAQDIDLYRNGLNVDAVHPRCGAKYSPNLYRWLTMRSRKHRAWTSQVYRAEDGALWIGRLDDGDFIGSRLNTVLCYGGKAESFCWTRMDKLSLVDDLWSRYERDGRCALDAAHQRCFVGDDTRWTVAGDTRSCLWCGKASQVLSRWTETVEREQWVPASSSAAGVEGHDRAAGSRPAGAR